MRILAVDSGSRRVGLALGDAAGRLASPHQVLQVRDDTDVIRQIAAIVASESVEMLLVGLPLNMDGSRGPAAAAAIQFGNALAGQCQKPVQFVDERLSSFEAEQSLVQAKRQGHKITRKKKKSRLDALAAAVFLQEYLDGKLQAIEP